MPVEGFDTCECEHVAHLDVFPQQAVGHAHHAYMELFECNDLVHVKTVYGTFRMCKDCATNYRQAEKEIAKQRAAEKINRI